GGLDGAVAGDHAISVTAVVPGKVMENPTPEDMVKMSTEATMPGPPKSLIPAKYAVHTSSGLTQTVSEDPSKKPVERKLRSQWLCVIGGLFPGTGLACPERRSECGASGLTAKWDRFRRETGEAGVSGKKRCGGLR